MAVIIAIIIAFALGLAAGALLLWRSLPTRLRQHIDYRERWQAAVELLANGGQLTEEQLKRVSGPAPASAPVPDDTPAGQRVLRSMASWDRKDIEIARAKAGLPPADDLMGMATWDKRDVLKARARYGTG